MVPFHVLEHMIGLGQLVIVRQGFNKITNQITVQNKIKKIITSSLKNLILNHKCSVRSTFPSQILGSIQNLRVGQYTFSSFDGRNSEGGQNDGGFFTTEQWPWPLFLVMTDFDGTPFLYLMAEILMDAKMMEDFLFSSIDGRYSVGIKLMED